jgi:chloramphenicol-sensitive protein RarD
VLLLTVTHRWAAFRAIWTDRRRIGFLVLAAVVITINWGAFIYGVTHDKVIETSLGYFINPPVTVLMGVLILGERLRPTQWVAMGIASLAVVVLTVDYGRLPWVALVLAFSFGTYGLAKKSANVEAVESLTLETILIAPFAAMYVGWLVATGHSNFGSHGVGHALLISSAGIITAIPLICFGAAAIRVSMVTLGLLQYLAPILQFGLGVLYFHEDMPAGRWIGFVLVWIALVMFTYEAMSHHRRRQLELCVEASAV